MNSRIFIGIYPEGILYADRARFRDGDYKRLAFLDYATLTLTIERDCPSELRNDICEDAAGIQQRAGERFKVSGSGQTVLLGSGMERKCQSCGGTTKEHGTVRWCQNCNTWEEYSYDHKRPESR